MCNSQNCLTCGLHYKLKKSDYSDKGCQHSDMDGYLCMAFADEGIGDWMVGCDPAVGMCEAWTETSQARKKMKQYEDALRFMVYQYCTKDSGKTFFNRCMTAGELAFKALGIENGQNVPENWLDWD